MSEHTQIRLATQPYTSGVIGAGQTFASVTDKITRSR